jgi:hypothetical protein
MRPLASRYYPRGQSVQARIPCRSRIKTRRFVAVAAPDVVGDTYRDAKSTIQATGAAVIIATKTGGLAEEDKCIVTNAWDKPNVAGSRTAPENAVWVALSCNAAVASPGSPGNSAASPEGRQALAAQEAG